MLALDRDILAFQLAIRNIFGDLLDNFSLGGDRIGRNHFRRDLLYCGRHCLVSGCNRQHTPSSSSDSRFAFLLASETRESTASLLIPLNRPCGPRYSSTG